MNKFFSMIIIHAVIIGLCTGDAISQIVKAKGAEVYAEWIPNRWYHGKIGDPCVYGYMVNFDDGDTKCCQLSEIASDAVPDRSSIVIGTKVIAQWTNGKYYPGTVAAITNNDYYIQFDDGDRGKVTLDKIRLRS